MIPSDLEDRAKLARSRHLVPKIKAAAAGAGLTVDEFVAGLPTEEGRQAAQLVEYDEYLAGKDAEKERAKAEEEATRTAQAHTELQGRYDNLEREHEELQRKYDVLFRRMMDGRERGS